jgi:Arc/MetJ-type ribon-helix-helix transcriptional regulator
MGRPTDDPSGVPMETVIQVRFTAADVAKLDAMIARGFGDTRSDVIRRLVRRAK